MFENIIVFIRNIYNTDKFIPLHEPRFIGNEKKYLEECINSTYVSSVGEFVSRFEAIVAEYTESDFAIVVVNGTEALHLSLLLAGVIAGDEVVTQPLTFVATANAIQYTGASPVFLDVDRETLGLSPDSLELFIGEYCEVRDDGCFNIKTGRRVAACLPMHTFGHPVKIDKIAEICSKSKIPLIEDAAESIGSKFKGKHTGTYGLIGVLSFNGNKIITTGGGGMILTSDPVIAKKAKHLTTQAKVTHPWKFFHDQTGYNFRMPNINAALGVAQMEQLPSFLVKKRELADAYINFFENLGIQIFKEPENAISNYWLNTIILKDLEERDLFLEITNKHGVMTRPSWELMTMLPMYKNSFSLDLINSKWLSERIVNLPSSIIV